MTTGDVLIVGAGVVGASVAYHLTRLGHDRVTVVDARDRAVLPGSTGLAPGFVGQLSATPELTILAKDTAFRNAPQGRRINGAFALTPDELPLVGQAAGVPGLWIAEASWVTHAGGVGRLLANLLLEAGDTLVDPGRLAPDRFDSWRETKIHETALGHYQGIYDAH